ncbi:partner of Y14 and mago-like isoform X2 [Cynara cardunculus var. scolymus]|uniref:Exon junction complex, Pym n=1 Tax=Cynara cardunculus var. scolymus TaxID=59895 RepID=A0A118K0R3_CYNCS|nr:partner of Y14 and mago-like isoform X2 [Cynara cardunculus var. scolymus]KVI01755.1 Exon junction complex, Pym [Cynara cardunculus var. scolymus]
MASSGAANERGGGEEEEAKELAAQLSKTLKEGERILAPTRRPDGTLRKPIRIRAGYVPQDEVAIYKSKGALLKKEMESLETVPPGYDPEVDVVSKPKSKSAKRNERKKEKRLQASLDKGKSEVSSTEDVDRASEPVESIVFQMNEITISGNPSVATPPLNSTECLATEDHIPDIDKRIRALKKKIRLTEAKTGNELKPEQLEKVGKLEDWRKELKLLEDKKASFHD